MKTKIIPNFVKNPQKIVELVENNALFFQQREGTSGHEGIIPNVQSQFSTLHHKDMSQELLDEIFNDSMFTQYTKDMYAFVQIQRYLPGDYICVHSDDYSVTKLHLINLTTSECDGLCLVEDGKVHKIYDVAGNYIDFEYDAYHWVDPVKTLRYSLVVGE